MKSARCKNLHLAGIDILLPALVCINGGHTGRRHMSLFVGFAERYDDNVIAPLVSQWLEHLVRQQFIEHGRGADGDLAAEAFYDRLAFDFADNGPFVSALIVSGDAAFDDSRNAPALPSQPAAPHNTGCSEERALARFIHGADFARWSFSGRIRAHLSTGTKRAQIWFEDLPGGITLAATGKSALSLPKALRDAHEIRAWYGFGIPRRNPADAVMNLRNEIAMPRRRAVETAADAAARV
jgi:hypothetical protein